MKHQLSSHSVLRDLHNLLTVHYLQCTSTKHLTIKCSSLPNSAANGHLTAVWQHIRTRVEGEETRRKRGRRTEEENDEMHTLKKRDGREVRRRA